MGNTQTCPTFNFFSDNFDVKNNFILDFQDKRILFCFKDEDITDLGAKISMEILDRPNENSSVTIRSLGNCQCKSDAKKYEPSATFEIRRDVDGFHKVKIIQGSCGSDNNDDLKKLIKDLEKAVIKYR